MLSYLKNVVFDLKKKVWLTDRLTDKEVNRGAPLLITRLQVLLLQAKIVSAKRMLAVAFFNLKFSNLMLYKCFKSFLCFEPAPYRYKSWVCPTTEGQIVQLKCCFLEYLWMGILELYDFFVCNNMGSYLFWMFLHILTIKGWEAAMPPLQIFKKICTRNL